MSSVSAAAGRRRQAGLAAPGVRRVTVGPGVMRATLGQAPRAVELRERGVTDLIGEWPIPFDAMPQLFEAAKTTPAEGRK